MILIGVGYKIEDRKKIRQTVEELYRKHPGPWLICANHLTLIDSAVIAYALAPLHRYMIHFNRLPWNMPEKKNFHNTIFKTMMTFVLKCIPVVRRGDRNVVAQSLAKCEFVLQKRESLLIFPEGTRSRAGYIDPEAVSYGVGRLCLNIPDCRVLCVYLRGEKQESYSDYPKWNQKFYVDVRPVELQPDGKGLRAQRDCAKKIIYQLAEMEKHYVDVSRQRCGEYSIPKCA
jgi:1-acyl-sn-glycerol-3-phosphate acyltransferase